MEEVSKNKLIYVASPYTHSLPEIVEERARLAAVCARKLIEKGYKPYVPIAYTHALDKLGKPLPHELWLALDRPFLQACAALLILDIAGWHASQGVALEVAQAKRMGLPIWFVNPVGRIYNSPSLLTMFEEEECESQ